MRRAPGYTALACLTLALGIGTNVAMFTVLRSVLWRPLPYPAPEQLVLIETDVRGVPNQGSAPAEVLDFRARSRALQQISTIAGLEAHVAIDGELERLPAASVSDNLLPLLGFPLASGRLMTEARDAVTTWSRDSRQGRRWKTLNASSTCRAARSGHARGGDRASRRRCDRGHPVSGDGGSAGRPRRGAARGLESA